MSTQFDEVVRISFEGSPSKLNELDCTTLTELSHFLTTVTSLARTLLARKDSAAEYNEQTCLVLSESSREGSSISVSIRGDENEHKINPTKLALKDAVHQVHSTYCAANRGNPIPNELPVEHLASLARIGENLPSKVEMTIQLQNDEIASVTADASEFLKMHLSETKNLGESTHKTDASRNLYKDLVDVTGKIFEVNVSANTFNIFNDENGCSISVNFDHNLESEVTGLLDDHENVRLHIFGAGIFDGLGNLLRITKIDSLESFQLNAKDAGDDYISLDEFANQLVENLPQSEIDKLPPDFAERHDEY